MFSRSEKIVFDLKLEVKKFSSYFHDQYDSPTKIISGKTIEIIKAIGKDNNSKKFQLVCLESDYTRFGLKIAKALKEMQIVCNTLIIDSIDGDLSSIKNIFESMDEEIIVFGDKKLINITRLYATSKNLNCHAILTNTNCSDLLKQTELKIGKQNKLKALTTIIIDSDLIALNNELLASLYIKYVSLIIPAFDYKLRLLTSLESFDNDNYLKLRYVITLLLNISSFSNPSDVIIYVGLIVSYLKEFSDILSVNTFKSVKNLLVINSKGIDEDILSFVALEKLVKLYFTFYNNDFYDLMSYVNYNDGVENLAKILGVDENNIYANLNVPSKERKDLIAALINKTRSKFLEESKGFLLSLKKIKQDFIFFKNKEIDKKVEYSKLKEAICLAPYIDNKITTLSLCRDFGLLACIK